MAIHDPLTGLPNRRYFEEAFGRSVASAKRGLDSAMLFMDVDFFKLINDTFGHVVGDEVLVTIGRLVSRHLRGEDLLSRISGDEFAVLLHGTPLDEAHVIAERIRQALSDYTFVFHHQEFHLSVSIGVAAIDGGRNTAAVMTHADDAMYMAKEQSRNCVILFATDRAVPGSKRFGETNAS
jgi:diguanylate cyclase (GGDEF)-like protein